MTEPTIRFLWKDPGATARFRTGVSLHGHTVHSKESLHFIPTYARKVPLLAQAIHGAGKGRSIDWSRAWWTPPLTPGQAWRLEMDQIGSLGLDGMVSLTDHDDIEAGLRLHVLEQTRRQPVSVEWTVPCAGTFLHIGVHGLPESRARELWREMDGAAAIDGLLCELHRIPGLLIVLNHPLWDEKGIGSDAHVRLLRAFLSQYGPWIHALELNGLRPWRENMLVCDIAREIGKPVISGGDRHGREPNANVNLTNAASFEEFAAEVRDGHSNVLFLPQYREGRTLRVIHQLREVLSRDPGHGFGWQEWNERIFYQCDDGRVKSLKELWSGGAPGLVRAFVLLASLSGHPGIRTMLELAIPKDEAAIP